MQLHAVIPGCVELLESPAKKESYKVKPGFEELSHRYLCLTLTLYIAMATNGSMTEVDSTHELPVLREAEKNDLDPIGPENPGSAIDEIPDGGAAAWLVVFGTWCTSFCSFGWINSTFTTVIFWAQRFD